VSGSRRRRQASMNAGGTSAGKTMKPGVDGQRQGARQLGVERLESGQIAVEYGRGQNAGGEALEKLPRGDGQGRDQEDEPAGSVAAVEEPHIDGEDGGEQDGLVGGEGGQGMQTAEPVGQIFNLRADWQSALRAGGGCKPPRRCHPAPQTAPQRPSTSQEREVGFERIAVHHEGWDGDEQ